MDLARVAAKFAASPLSFEDYCHQMPWVLIDMIDRAHHRPVRTARQHYTEYLARVADPAARLDDAEALAAARRANLVLEAEILTAAAVDDLFEEKR